MERAILPTAVVLIAVSAGGTWTAINAAIVEQQQAADMRRAATFAEMRCLQFCPDCIEFCPPPIREANETHGRVQVSQPKGDIGRSSLYASVLRGGVR